MATNWTFKAEFELGCAKYRYARENVVCGKYLSAKYSKKELIKVEPEYVASVGFIVVTEIELNWSVVESAWLSGGSILISIPNEEEEEVLELITFFDTSLILGKNS